MIHLERANAVTMSQLSHAMEIMAEWCTAGDKAVRDLPKFRSPNFEFLFGKIKKRKLLPVVTLGPLILNGKN